MEKPDNNEIPRETTPNEEQQEPSSSHDEEDQLEDSSLPQNRLEEAPPPEKQLKSSSNESKSLRMKEVSISTGAISESSFMNRTSGQRSSRDACTNTHRTISIRTADVEGDVYTEDHVKVKKLRNCINGLIDRHTWAMGTLPILHKFLFFVPIRYGVYVIISTEEIYFFLRSYSRILHIAMPYFFPELASWLATTELLLCLGTLVSDLFLLFGVFINPTYIFFWIDIHIFEILIYLYLILWLSVYGSEPIYEYPLLFSSYILGFTYAIVIVNSYRRHWNTARARSSEICAPPHDGVTQKQE